MITILLPKQPNETTDEYVKRVNDDAENYAEARRDFFRNEKCREKKKQVKSSMTGMAIMKMGGISEAICHDCGKVEKIEPMYCRECGCEDYCEVWNIEGEWYYTGEEFCKQATNVKINEGGKL